MELSLDINQFCLGNVRVNEALGAEMSPAGSRYHPKSSLIIAHSQFYLVGLQAGMMQIRAVKSLSSRCGTHLSAMQKTILIFHKVRFM